MQLLDRLEEEIGAGWHMPGTGKTMVNEGALLDLIDTIRTSVPGEVVEARELIQQRDQVLDAARSQADDMMKEAQEKADALTSDQNVYRLAQQSAKLVLEKAANDAQAIQDNANDYAIDSLTRLEAQLSQTLATVRNGIDALRDTGD